MEKRVLLFFATLPLYHKANEEALTVYYIHCGKTFETFKSTREMWKTLTWGSSFQHFSRVLNLMPVLFYRTRLRLLSLLNKESTLQQISKAYNYYIHVHMHLQYYLKTVLP